MKILKYTISEGLCEYAAGFYFLAYFPCRGKVFYVK
jgi:hypothetical protein